MLKYGRAALVSELSGTLGQVLSRPDEDGSSGSEGRLAAWIEPEFRTASIAGARI